MNLTQPCKLAPNISKIRFTELCTYLRLVGSINHGIDVCTVDCSEIEHEKRILVDEDFILVAKAINVGYWQSNIDGEAFLFWRVGR